MQYLSVSATVSRVKLKEHKFETRYKKAVNVYIFSCCTGICCADMMNLNATHLEDDADLGLVITNKRQKVSSIYSTPHTRFAKEIYDEFGSLEAIPKITNQKVNDYIKIALPKIAYPDADIITFHTGRETFINHCLNDLGMPPDDICTKFMPTQKSRKQGQLGFSTRN